jgi:hypothetical protein
MKPRIPELEMHRPPPRTPQSRFLTRAERTTPRAQKSKRGQAANPESPIPNPGATGQAAP